MEAACGEKIEYGRLRLQCGMAVQALLGFRTVEEPGEHGRGVFRVRLEAGTEGEDAGNLLQDSPVALQELDADGNPRGLPLFSGHPEEIRLFSGGGYREAEITVLSGTVLFDRVKRDRVFQAPGQDYGDITGRVAGNTQNGACILTVPDRKTGMPFFQCGETDWEFLKRVASRMGLPLVADSGWHHPRFYVGLRRGAVKVIPRGSSYTLSFDGERYYGMKDRGSAVAREDFFCYDVATWVNLELGERTRLDGKELSVNRKEMVLQDGTVEFRYRLAGPGYSLVAPGQNVDMTGMGLAGEVAGTAGEMCELALDLEPGQGGGQKYPFAPGTGSFMYCMPQTGTRVYLDLGDGTEAGAMVSGCIRTNGAECEGTGDPANKNFHTEHGKGMEMHPESMCLAGGEAGSLLLDDECGATLASATDLIAYAKGGIRLEGGRTIDVEALSGIFAQALEAATSCLCINERFDYLAAGTLLKGDVYSVKEPFDDAPAEGHFDWGGFFRNIAIGLAVVAVCVAAAAVVVATGGGAAALMAGTLAAGSKIALGACVGAAIGALTTTVSMSVEDFNDGDVRSWQEAALEIGVSTISGAITGALGAKFPKMGKIVSGLIDTAISTAERGIIAGFMEDMTFEEWLAYTLDPRVMAVNFIAGVLTDCALEKLGKLLKGGTGHGYSVDSTMFPDDEAAGVLRNGEYVKNPTAHNINDYISEGSNYLGSKNMNGQYMYVVDMDGNIIIGTRGGQRMPHPTLVGGGNPQVQAAGIVEIRGGKIYSINNASGHFKPSVESLGIAEDAFSNLPQNIFSQNFQGYLPYGG